MNVTEVEREIDKLVSDLACCDRDGCLCYEAQEVLRAMATYANFQLDNAKSPAKIGSKE